MHNIKESSYCSIFSDLRIEARKVTMVLIHPYPAVIYYCMILPNRIFSFSFNQVAIAGPFLHETVAIDKKNII